MEDDLAVGVDPEEIKSFLHGFGLIPLNDYYKQLRRMLKGQTRSSKAINEQIEKKLIENGIHKDDLSKNLSLICPRKRTSFSPVITRKRGKAIKKRTPSNTPTTADVVTTVADENDTSTQKPSDDANAIDYDQPLDLRLQTNSNRKT